MIKVFESDLRAFSKCKHLHKIGGTALQLTKSQRLFSRFIKDFYLLVIKNKVTDIDNDLYKIIKKLVYNYYPNILPDDFSTLTKYLLDGFDGFIKKFNNDDFSIIISDYDPVVTSYDGIKLSLHFDLFFKQNIKSSYLHGVVFVPLLDKHHCEYDLLNYIKLKFLKSIYSKRRAAHPATYLHLVYIPNIVFNNKNLKAFPIRFKKLTEKDITSLHLRHLKILLEDFKQTQETFPIPGCSDKACTKRKECNYDNSHTR